MRLGLKELKQIYYEGNFSHLTSLFCQEQLSIMPEDVIMLFAYAFCDMGKWNLFDICINKLICSENTTIADKALITKMRVDYTLGRSNISAEELINQICEIEKKHLANNSFILFVRRNKYYINRILIVNGEKDASFKYNNLLEGNEIFKEYYEEEANESIGFLSFLINDSIDVPSPNIYLADELITQHEFIFECHHNTPSIISFYESVMRYYLVAKFSFCTYEQIHSSDIIKLIFDNGLQCGHCCARELLDAVIGDFLLEKEDIIGLDIIKQSIATFLKYGHYRKAENYYRHCENWIKTKGISYHPILDFKSLFCSHDYYCPLVFNTESIEKIYQGFTAASYQEALDLCQELLSATHRINYKIESICFILNNNEKIHALNSKTLIDIAKYGIELLKGVNYSILFAELYTHMALSHIGDEKENWENVTKQLDYIGDNDYTASKLELFLEVQIGKCLNNKESAFNRIEIVNRFRRLYEILSSNFHMKNRPSHFAKWYELLGEGYFNTNMSTALRHFQKAKEIYWNANSYIQYGIIQHKIACVEIELARNTRNIEKYSRILESLASAIDILKSAQLSDFVWRLQFLQFVAQMETELYSNQELSHLTESYLLDAYLSYASIYNKIDPSRVIEAQQASIALGNNAENMYKQGFRFYSYKKDWKNCIMWLERLSARSLNNALLFDNNTPPFPTEKDLTFDYLLKELNNQCENTNINFVYFYEWNDNIFIIGLRPKMYKTWAKRIEISTTNLINDIKMLRIEMMTFPLTKEGSIFFSKYGFLALPIIENTEPDEPICIIPYGFLCDIPFHALVHNELTLIERNPIVYNASISCWLHLHSQDSTEEQTNIISIIGDPQNNLYGANKESKSLAQLMNAVPIEGKDVSKQKFLSLLSESHIFHYSGHCHITHSDDKLSEINYSNFQLVLNNDSITLEDIIKTKNHADLVVLSACDTGLHNHYVGQELLGFPTAFLFSGSQSVISSMWPVDDNATESFFFRYYNKIKEKKNKTYALRETIIEEMDLQNKNTYYWAAFIIWGR